jgi:hypothetical protein
VPAFTSAVHSAEVTAVSCTPATTAAARESGLNCVAAGVSQLPAGTSAGFVLAEVHGTWRAAQPVPGLGSARPGSAVTTVSCPSPGSCGIGGYYSDKSGHRQAFVASEVSGTWHKAQQVPGTATLNAGGNASVTSVSCPAAATCVAAVPHDRIAVRGDHRGHRDVVGRRGRRTRREARHRHSVPEVRHRGGGKVAA